MFHVSCFALAIAIGFPLLRLTVPGGVRRYDLRMLPCWYVAEFVSREHVTPTITTSTDFLRALCESISPVAFPRVRALGCSRPTVHGADVILTQRSSTRLERLHTSHTSTSSKSIMRWLYSKVYGRS